MKPIIGLIYKYTSPSNKVYIGQTINESSRKSQHKKSSTTAKTYFAKAIQKHGFENFKYEVLIKFQPTSNLEKLKRVLDKLEQRYIKLYKSNQRDFGYNLNEGGNGNRGFKHSEETKQYISECSKQSMTKERRQETSIRFKELWASGKMDFLKERESPLKGVESKKKGRGKLIYQYDLNNNLITTFTSIGDAARSLINTATFKTKSNRISEVCQGKHPNYQNYIWKSDDTPIIEDDYSWIINIVQGQELLLQEIQDIFISLFELRGLKYNQHSISKYFPQHTKIVKYKEGRKGTYYIFD